MTTTCLCGKRWMVFRPTSCVTIWSRIYMYLSRTSLTISVPRTHPQVIGHPIDSGIGLSITMEKIRVFINKTLSNESLMNQLLIRGLSYQLLLIVGIVVCTLLPLKLSVDKSSRSCDLKKHVCVCMWYVIMLQDHRYLEPPIHKCVLNNI